MKHLRTLVTLGVVLLPLVSQAAWIPPIGIPSPPFGLTEVAPATPSPWTTGVAGFYYVDRTNAAATDTANPYGWPAKPRKSLPYLRGGQIIPAGSVVEVHGIYDFPHGSADAIWSGGTALAPVFIRGVSSLDRPEFQQTLQVFGSYCILENILSTIPAGRTTGGVTLSPWNNIDSDHLVVRHAEFSGNPAAHGGVSIFTPGGNGTHAASYTVIYDTYIHDQGNVYATTDQDSHCITINSYAHYTWIIDNELARCSGDGLQINASTFAQGITFTYVGRNHSHHHKQYGLGTKQSEDTIMSQNLVHALRVSNSSTGGAMYMLYGPIRCWFIYNTLYDVENGFHASDQGASAVRTQHYYLGNVGWDIHERTYPTRITTGSTSYNPVNGFSNAAVSIYAGTPGGIDTWIVNNTFNDVDGCIYTGNVTGPGIWTIRNTICSLFRGPATITTIPAGGTLATGVVTAWNYVDRGGYLYNFGSSGGAIEASGLSADYNVVDASRKVFWGVLYTNRAAWRGAYPAQGVHDVTADPLFVDAATGNLRLTALSPANDTGVSVPNPYTTFQGLYGLNIQQDLTGTSRPQGSGWDMGAYETTTSTARCQ